MNDVLSPSQALAFITSGNWITHRGALSDWIKNPPVGLRVPDEDGNNALFHLLMQCLRTETFEEAQPLLEVLVACGMCPWDKNNQGDCAYRALVRGGADTNVLMWCWTLSCEPGHVEVNLMNRVASDRLDALIARYPIPGSPEQTQLRHQWGLGWLVCLPPGGMVKVPCCVCSQPLHCLTRLRLPAWFFRGWLL